MIRSAARQGPGTPPRVHVRRRVAAGDDGVKGEIDDAGDVGSRECAGG